VKNLPSRGAACGPRTTRVLTAAIMGKPDDLRGLKADAA
jgi:hypothetical protein